MKTQLLFILISFYFVSCKRSVNPIELNGLYCNQINHCIYFGSDKCIIDRAEIENYKLISNHELGLLNSEDSIKYQIELDNTTLRVRKSKEEPFREFQRMLKMNSNVIEDLYFSSLSETSDLELHLTANHEIKMRINYHDKFEIGTYKGEVPKTLYNFISQLANTIEFSIPPILRTEIISDIQEWGMQIRSDKLYNIYHNYEEINQNHRNLAFLLEKIPYFIRLEKTNSQIELNEIKEFRKNEFKRNLEENDL